MPRSAFRGNEAFFISSDKCFYKRSEVFRTAVQPFYDFQSFPESLKMHNLAFSQEAKRLDHIGIIRHVDEIFVRLLRFLFCSEVFD